MSAEHEMAVAIATEIGKQVPVKQLYEDTTSPAAKQVGATLEDVVKCVRLVGFPIQWLAVQQDRFRAFIERAKNQVPEERRVLPPPQILGPILEGIRYEINDSPVVDMFEALLGCAMDVDRADKTHPSYPGIIKSLSPDEALLLKALMSEPVTGLAIETSADKMRIHRLDVPEEIVRWGNAEFYLEHMKSLGLVEFWFDLNMDNLVAAGGKQATPIRYSISWLGRQFMTACTRPA